MSTLIQLNLSNVSPERDGADVFTEGLHMMKVSSVERGQSKSGSGYYIKTEMRCVSGIDQGKTLVEYLNYINNKEETQRMAQARIKKILMVGGHSNPNHLEDAAELIGLEFVAQITNKEETFTGSSGEEITTTRSNLYKVKDKEGFVPMSEVAQGKVSPEKSTSPVATPAPTAPVVAPAPVATPAPAAPATPAPATTAAPAATFPWSK